MNSMHPSAFHALAPGPPHPATCALLLPRYFAPLRAETGNHASLSGEVRAPEWRSGAPVADETRQRRLWRPAVVHALKARDGLELIAVGGPKPEGRDGVRSERHWRGAGES